MANRPFDWSSLFFAALSFLDVIQQCRLGYRPTDRRHLCLNDRRHLCLVIACVIKLDKVCKEIAEWEGWDAKEYKKMLTDYPERYKARTNRAFVCFGKSRKQIQPDLGNWWYAFLYYYLHLQRPEFVEQLSRLKGSLQVNRGPITEATSISTRATGRFLASTSTASLSSSRAWHIQICMLASTLWACSLGVFRIDRNEIKSRSNQIAKDVDVDVDLSSATMQFS